MSGGVMAEVVRAGSGYDIQDVALKRLGAEVAIEFNQATTSGQLLAFAEKYRPQMTEEEIKEFIGYSDYIGLLFGYQD
jgi:hypothetical protein